MSTPGSEAANGARDGFSAEDVVEGESADARSPEAIIERSPRYSHAKRSRFDPAQGLGWLSVGLGLAGVVAPQSLGRLIGMPGNAALLRLVGARELASGAGLLTTRPEHRARWLWSRVVGDAMDLALLGTALRPSNPGRGRAIGALAAVAAITAMDVAASVRETSRPRQDMRTGEETRAEPLIEHTIAVNRSAQECYAFWRDVSNLSRFTPLLESVTKLDERRSHWVMRGPRATTIEWDSEITVDRPGERIAWHSLSGPMRHAGVVRFERAPGGRGTFVTAMMHYQPSGGRLASGIAKLLGKDPDHRVREDLRRFKSLIETGEVPSTHGQPSGRRSFFGRMTRDGRQSREGR